MSDNWFTFVSSDPKWHPTEPEVIQRLITEITAAFPQAEDVQPLAHQKFEFVGAGENLETISCPYCDHDLMDWWSEIAAKTYEGGYNSLECVVPCCGKNSSLNDLKYDWPCAFAMFQLDVMNPDERDVSELLIAKLELITSQTIRVIRSHT